MDNQRFKKGDVALLNEFVVKITEVIQDEDGYYWYEVIPMEFNSFPREVSQDQLREYGMEARNV